MQQAALPVYWVG